MSAIYWNLVHSPKFVNIRMLTQLPYPTVFGHDITPPHRDRLEYFKFRCGDSFWFQRDNWWNQNQKSAKSPWQYWNLKPFRQLLNKRSGVIIDIGANIGMTAVQFAQWGYDVLAFEPSIQTCNLLTHNLSINNVANKVTVYQNAVSDDCYVGLFRDQHNYSGVSCMIEKISGRPTQSEYQDVDAVSLDSLTLPLIAGVKIDTEGHEYAALKGSVALIARDRPVFLVELLGKGVKGKGAKRFDWSPQDVMDLFAQYDYRAYNKDLVAYKKWAYKRNYSDFIFVPKESDPLDTHLFYFPDR